MTIFNASEKVDFLATQTLHYDRYAGCQYLLERVDVDGKCGLVCVEEVDGQAAGFPTGSGNPSSGFTLSTSSCATSYLNSARKVDEVIGHELGHCIGFRHTDYMNRSFSCGSGGNEGQETTGVGAVHISGTPTGPDAASWMLACLSSTTDRPFNSNDRKALDYLY